jgi:hypothetical protein
LIGSKFPKATPSTGFKFVRDYCSMLMDGWSDGEAKPHAQAEIILPLPLPRHMVLLHWRHGLQLTIHLNTVSQGQRVTPPHVLGLD